MASVNSPTSTVSLSRNDKGVSPSTSSIFRIARSLSASLSSTRAENSRRSRQDDPNVRRHPDHMIIRHDDPVLRQDHAGPKRVLNPRAAGVWPPEETFEEGISLQRACGFVRRWCGRRCSPRRARPRGPAAQSSTGSARQSLAQFAQRQGKTERSAGSEVFSCPQICAAIGPCATPEFQMDLNPRRRHKSKKPLRWQGLSEFLTKAARFSLRQPHRPLRAPCRLHPSRRGRDLRIR